MPLKSRHPIVLFIALALSLAVTTSCAQASAATVSAAAAAKTTAAGAAAAGVAATRMTTAQDTRFLKISKGADSRQFVAHRGLASVYPENTLPAFESSCQRGYWGVELDVHETSDGSWVVMHDSTIDRTTNGTGAVSSLTLAQIKALTVDSGSNIDRYPGMKVPTLAEALALFARYDAVPVIEVKASTTGGYDTLVSLLRQYGLEEKCVVASFSREILDGIRTRSKIIPLLHFGKLDSDSIDWIAKRVPSLIGAPQDQTTSALVREAHQKGVSVVPYSVETPSARSRQLECGVDLMITDTLP